MSAGYLFRLDWQTPPVSSELTLHARMNVSDGRQFDATTQVKVNPSPRAPSRIAKVSHDVPKRSTVTRKPGAPAARKSPQGVGHAKVSQTRSVSGENATPPAAPPPRIRPSAGPGHAEPPTQTSDKWTDETIPTLR
jgi:hypothetical protein